MWQILYAWLIAPLMQIGVHVAALKNQNLKDGLRGRIGLWQRLDEQLRQRQLKKPLIWFHVSSAGELLQAQPVLERCMQHGYECALTFTSVNAYKWLQRAKFPEGRRPVVIDYLPLDSRRDMRRLLRLFQPHLIVYVKYDLWPNLLWEAQCAGIPQYLISATLQPRSSRLTSRIGRSFYHALYQCLDGIFAVTDADRDRFRLTNPDHPNIETVGDTKFDNVLDRKRCTPLPVLPEQMKDKFIVIAGSSWPPDEEVIFPALKEALGRYDDVTVIIVPHEPTEEHIRPAERFFQEFGVIRFTQIIANPSLQGGVRGRLPRVIVGDTVGILASLYSAGALAYVGGAFTTGVHNITEPCAMGLPVIFGPKYYTSPEAGEFLKRGFAFTIQTPDEFRALLFRFLEHRAECRALGQQAIAAIEAQAGVADRCFELLTQAIRVSD